MKHLAYYIYPVKYGRETWQHNVDEIKKRISLFDGRKLVSIAYGSTRTELDPVDMVIEHFDDPTIVYIPVSHAPDPTHENSHGHRGKLGEVIAFAPMLRILEGTSSRDDLIFYGHAKGVTHKTDRKITGVHDWTDLMYGALLDHFKEVDQLLTDYPIVGSFKRHSPNNLGSHDWHYAGTMFWMRCDQLYTRNWDVVPPWYGGVEAWPGSVYVDAEAGCVFGDIRGEVSLYSVEGIAKFKEAYLKWWM